MNELLQAAAEKAAKAAKRLYVGNLPFETSQAELTSFFDAIMADTSAVAADTEEQGSAVTSCTLYDRSSAAAGPKAKYAFLNLRSVEETSNCVAFDGVYFKTNCLKVRSLCETCLLVCLSVSVRVAYLFRHREQTSGRLCTTTCCASLHWPSTSTKPSDCPKSQ